VADGKPNIVIYVLLKTLLLEGSQLNFSSKKNLQMKAVQTLPIKLRSTIQWFRLYKAIFWAKINIIEENHCSVNSIV